MTPSPPDEPFLTPSIPPVKAKFKAWAEDFIVEELPLYPPLGSGHHLYLWIEKKGLNTPDVTQALSEMTGVKLSTIGYAGLKDKQSVSRQWISVPADCEPRLARVKLEGLTILSTTRHRNKLRVGHLRGNRFIITLRDEGLAAADLDRARQVLDELRRRGLPNYFGRQRFSRQDPGLKRAKQLLAGGLSGRKLHWEERFILNSLQSAVFNAVLSARMNDGLFETILPGDIGETIPFGGQFLVEDAAEAQTRRTAGAIAATGPMPGPDMRQPTGAALEFERAAIAATEYEALDFAAAPLKGERRPLSVPLLEAGVELLPGQLRLYFELSSGVYATNVVREILKQAV